MTKVVKQSYRVTPKKTKKTHMLLVMSSTGPHKPCLHANDDANYAIDVNAREQNFNFSLSCVECGDDASAPPVH